MTSKLIYRFQNWKIWPLLEFLTSKWDFEFKVRFWTQSEILTSNWDFLSKLYYINIRYRILRLYRVTFTRKLGLKSLPRKSHGGSKNFSKSPKIMKRILSTYPSGSPLDRDYLAFRLKMHIHLIYFSLRYKFYKNRVWNFRNPPFDICTLVQ